MELARTKANSYHELQSLPGATGLEDKTAVVVGCGAIGGELIPHLAMLPLAGITLIDHDRVEPKNLSNQGFDARHVGLPKGRARREQIRRIDPRRQVEIIQQRVETTGLGVFRGAAVIFSCLDNFASRIWLSEVATLVGRPWVDAATDGTGERKLGKVTSYAGDPEAACMVCSWDETRWELAGRSEPGKCPSWWDADSNAPTLSGSAECGVIASFQCIHGVERLRNGREAGSHEVCLDMDAGRASESGRRSLAIRSRAATAPRGCSA